ncbi:hypothetical protein MRX96_058067 [Rhipicephalus microplus]
MLRRAENMIDFKNAGSSTSYSSRNSCSSSSDSAPNAFGAPEHRRRPGFQRPECHELLTVREVHVAVV